MKAIRLFIYSAGIILLITASAKFLSAAGAAKVLEAPDPIFTVRFRDLFWFVGAVEFAVGFICLFSKRLWLQTVLLLSLAASFLLYRIGTWWIGFEGYCKCLGTLTDSIGVSPQNADTLMKFLLGYLTLGSCAAMLFLAKADRSRAID